MKKFAFLAILVLFFMAVFNVAFDMHDFGDSHVMFDGEEIDGPLGWLIGLVAGGFGLLVGALALVFAGVVVALVFAGLGVMAVVGVSFGAIVLALAVSPLLLPLLIPVGIVWLIVRRNKRRAAMESAAAPAPAAPIA